MANLNDNTQPTSTTAMTSGDAERITSRIKLLLDTIADESDKVVDLIEQAKAGRAYEALGFPSWTAYVADKFGGVLGRLNRSDRVPVVEALAETGMSTRAIASVVGVDHATVVRDMAGGADAPPDTDVSGTDGKTYKRKSIKTTRQNKSKTGDKVIPITSKTQVTKPPPRPAAARRKRDLNDVVYPSAFTIIEALDAWTVHGRWTPAPYVVERLRLLHHRLGRALDEAGGAS